MHRSGLYLPYSNGTGFRLKCNGIILVICTMELISFVQWGFCPDLGVFRWCVIDARSAVLIRWAWCLRFYRIIKIDRNLTLLKIRLVSTAWTKNRCIRWRTGIACIWLRQTGVLEWLELRCTSQGDYDELGSWAGWTGNSLHLVALDSRNGVVRTKPSLVRRADGQMADGLKWLELIHEVGFFGTCMQGVFFFLKLNSQCLGILS